MTLPAPTYDLMLLLDPEAEEATRAKIVADARAAIEARGEFLRHDEWGDRTLTYPIERKAVAEYHLIQFHAGGPELLGTLDRALRITDGIMRFRIIKLKPGVPEAPSVLGAPAAERQAEVETVLETPPEPAGPAETASVASDLADTAADAGAPADLAAAPEPPADAEPPADGEPAADAEVGEPA